MITNESWANFEIVKGYESVYVQADYFNWDVAEF